MLKSQIIRSVNNKYTKNKNCVMIQNNSLLSLLLFVLLRKYGPLAFCHIQSTVLQKYITHTVFKLNTESIKNFAESRFRYRLTCGNDSFICEIRDYWRKIVFRVLNSTGDYITRFEFF